MPIDRDDNAKIDIAVDDVTEQNMAGNFYALMLISDASGTVVFANRAALNVYGYSAAEFHEVSIRELYSPVDRQIFDEQLIKVGHEAVVFQASQQKRNGMSFAAEILLQMITFNKKRMFVSLVRDLNESKTGRPLKSHERKYQLLHEELLAAHEELTASEEELRQQFDELLVKEEKIYRQNTVLSLLHDTAMGLMTEFDDNDILKKIITAIVDIFGVANSYMDFVNAEKDTFRLKIGTGIFDGIGYEAKVTDGLFGKAYATGQYVSIDDYKAWEQRLPDPVFDDVYYLVLLPLKNGERIIGSIGLAFTEPGKKLDDYELSLLQRFADLASLALSNAMLVGSLNKEIEERKQTEKNLRYSEERFYRIYEMIPSTIAVARLDGTYLMVNENFCKSTGYTREELVGSKREQINLWVDTQDLQFLLKGLRADGQVNNLEAWFRTKSGNKIRGLMSARLVTIHGEECILTVTHDITELRSIKEQLALSEKKFSQAFYLSPDAMVITQEDGTLLEVNQSFTRLHGYSREEAIGKRSVDLALWQDPLERSRVVKRLCQDGEVRDVETRFLHRNGTRLYVHLSARLLNVDNKPHYMFAARDISARVRLEEERHRQEEKIQHMAYFDLLTGLPNRRHVNERLNGEIQRALRDGMPGTVLFLDLDDLKMVNDTYGHTYGDKIISAVGKQLVVEAGKDAFVARVGGDEFIILLPGKNDRRQIEGIVERITKKLGRKQEILKTRFHMTASIGIAAYPADGDTVEEIIKNADNAMYAAKRNGKNCWCFYTPAMQTEAYQKMQLISGLRYALKRGEFSLVYQPQIVIHDGRVASLEALLRWNRAEGGPVSPLQFIPLAEQSGLIHRIGQWVLFESCRFARRLAEQGWSGIRVAVNISSKQLAAADFIPMIRSAINAAGIEPCQLELEITESLLMASLEDATSKLSRLKNMGVRISLDDFGTGYSSLTYLRKLPVETLKIDKTFIDMITADAHSVNLIGSIINMAHTLNMTVVAEGVETEQQLRYLADNGCDLIQGYLYSRPVPEAEAIRFLNEASKGSVAAECKEE